jgi:hypothetical protein
MAVSAKAKVNIDIHEGVTFEQTFQWLEEDGVTPVDLTGYDAEMHVRDKITDAEPKLALTSDDGEIVFTLTPEDGFYTIIIPADKTAGICPRHKIIVGVYDLKFSKAGVVLLQQYGSARMIPAVTR